MEKNENGYYTDNTNNGYNMNIRTENAPRQLAMVYSPYQHFKELYSLDKALERGTIFAQLDLPFEGGNGEGCKR